MGIGKLTTSPETGPNASPQAVNAASIPADWKLKRDGWGRLVLIHSDGREVPGIQPVRCFPLTEPDRWISLLEPTGHETMMIADLNPLPETVQAVLRAELSDREFIPVVQKILSVTGDSPPCEWTIETSRGTTTFLLDSEDHLRKLEPNRVLITDAHGVRYDIPNRARLDAESEKLLRKFL